MSIKRDGCFGGGGGRPFDTLPPGASDFHVIGFSLRADRLIDGIQLFYKGQPSWYYGGSGGRPYTQFFDDDEFITGISGTSGNFVDGLTIFTNKRLWTYGGSGPAAFNYTLEEGQRFVGWWGAAGTYLDRIGIIIQT